eukprot:TRINITY_DN2171_c1_g1_i2.p1 TRINITY_DN2171_c1_g1~~TRINITY_DN2171_c1_g1_i2.p1  ORF type:complete len:526 (+),score=109.91 TRINITY_DN2171_c1_g1_i2:219-1796(+)
MDTSTRWLSPLAPYSASPERVRGGMCQRCKNSPKRRGKEVRVSTPHTDDGTCVHHHHHHHHTVTTTCGHVSPPTQLVAADNNVNYSNSNSRLATDSPMMLSSVTNRSPMSSIHDVSRRSSHQSTSHDPSPDNKRKLRLRLSLSPNNTNGFIETKPTPSNLSQTVPQKTTQQPQRKSSFISSTRRRSTEHTTPHKGSEQSREMRNIDTNKDLERSGSELSSCGGFPVKFYDDDGDLIEFIPWKGGIRGSGCRYSVNNNMRKGFTTCALHCDQSPDGSVSWRLRCDCQTEFRNVILPKSDDPIQLISSLCTLLDWCGVTHNIQNYIDVISSRGTSPQPSIQPSDHSVSVRSEPVSSLGDMSESQSPPIPDFKDKTYAARLQKHEARMKAYWKNKKLVTKAIYKESLPPKSQQTLRALQRGDERKQEELEKANLAFADLIYNHMEQRTSIQSALNKSVELKVRTPPQPSLTPGADIKREATAIGLRGDLRRREVKEQFLKDLMLDDESSGEPMQNSCESSLVDSCLDG